MANGLDGETALVTGGTDGIGKAIARELATRGADVLIVGRDPEKGARAERELRASAGRFAINYLSRFVLTGRLDQTIQVGRARPAHAGSTRRTTPLGIQRAARGERAGVEKRGHMTKSGGSGSSRGVIWFNRLLLVAATGIMTMIALRTLRDPVGSTSPMGIVLTSATAATVVRVGFGGFPLGFAVALFGCVVSTRRLLGGLFLLASIAGAATLARLQGIVLDGATPYNLVLLRPEIALCVLSAVGIVLERRRRRVKETLEQL